MTLLGKNPFKEASQDTFPMRAPLERKASSMAYLGFVPKPKGHLRVVTWNINSIRARIQHLQRVIEMLDPDIVCLQETKVADDAFPKTIFEEMGFNHIWLCGQKAWHGTSIASKWPGTCQQKAFESNHQDRARIQTIRFEQWGGWHLSNIYAPSGGGEPDLVHNEKFIHKRDFYHRLTQRVASSHLTAAPHLLVGDLNIAPHPCDVFDTVFMKDVISHTAVEKEWMATMQGAMQARDLVREVAGDHHLYTWWSYRSDDWVRSNRGLRLDHIWACPRFSPHHNGKSGACWGHVGALMESRLWTKASDHVPLYVDLVLG